MAKTAPISTTHQGVVYGRFSASSRPVTPAASGQSKGRFISHLQIAHSSSTQDTMLTASTSSIDQP